MTVRRAIRSSAVLLATAAAALGLAACGGSSSPAANPSVTSVPVATTAAASSTGAASPATTTKSPGSSTSGTGTAGSSKGTAHTLTLLAAAVHKVNTEHSAKVWGTVTTKVAGQRISLKLAGVERWSPTIAATMTMSGMSVGGVSMGTIKMIMTPKAMYMNMPALTAQTHKRWAELSYAALKKSSGVDIGQLTRQAQQMQPAQYLQMLTVSGNVKLVGTEKVDGVTTAHYAGSVDPAKALEAVSPQARAAWASLAPGGGIEKVGVWVDHAGRPRRVTAAVTTSVLTMAMDLHLSSYGIAVSVTPPPANQTVDLAALLPHS